MTTTPSVLTDELDDFVRAYENAWQQPGTPELPEFLPARSHPLFVPVLCELVRIDLEFRWRKGKPRPLGEYQSHYPELFRDPSAANQVAYEEYRLRRRAGEQPDPEEYAKQFGIDTSDWFRPDNASHAAAPNEAEGSEDLAPTERFGAAEVQIYRSFLEHAAAADGVEANSPEHDRAVHEHGQLLRELSVVSPPSARRLAQAMTHFPEPGTQACGFHLLAELGRGAFARVYLARQGELANRPVAAKFSPDTFFEESQTLAQLQHTNIVPIYSLHRAPPFVVVCMPYFGATTLADLIRALHAKKELPASGRELVSTLEDSCKLSISTLATAAPSEPVPRPAAPPRPAALLQRWKGLSYVEAVLWIAARLVEGLQHAHERGILHRDLKPANVLLTDEGEPMLLDFNLAENVGQAGAAATAKLGGTLPYMAPECLEALLQHTPTGDARSDLYAVGMILYELLTGRHAFPGRRGPAREAAAMLLQDRRAVPASLRRWNRGVSRAVSAIVLKCLQPDPARRYQSAAQLRDDLERQLQHRPLRYAPDRSIRERAAKWIKRHPRLASSSTVAAVAFLLLAGLASLFYLYAQHQAWLQAEADTRQTRLQAETDLHQLRQALQTISFLLAKPDAEAGQLAEGIALCRKHADQFGVLEEQNWQQSARVQALDNLEREELRQGMGELLWFWARAEAWKIPALVNSNEQRQQVQFGLKLATLAGACYTEREIPAPLLRQQSKLLELAGNLAEAKQFRAQAEATPPRSPREHYLVLCEQVGDGQFRQALPFLQQATLHGPGNSALWLILGNCHAELGELAEAKACFDHGLALDSDSPWAWFNRGLLLLEQEKYATAREDFTKALQLRPKMVEALMNRAVVELKLNNPQAAIKDLNLALELKAPYTRIYFMRAEAKLALKDAAGAKKDREQGLLLQPGDELSWVSRGVHRLKLAKKITPKDIQQALADFEEALKLNPKSAVALENKAAILSEYLHRTAEAVQVLGKAVKFHPHVAAFWSGRGVLLARLGKRTEAHQDAVKALSLSQKPELTYQVAGIYALTSGTHPEDRKEALRLLQKAFAEDKNLLNLVPIDQELNPIRGHPDFQALVKLASKF